MHMEVLRVRMTNISALTSYNSLMTHNANLEKSIRRLSTGLRINSAADDPAGMAISQKMEAQIRGTDQEIRNLQDSMMAHQSADTTLGDLQDVMQRMRVLAVQGANGTLSEEDREYIRIELEQMAEYAENLVGGSRMNGVELLRDNFRDYFKSYVVSAVYRDEERATEMEGVVGGLLEQDLSMSEIYESIFHTIRTSLTEEENRIRVEGRTIFALEDTGAKTAILNLADVGRDIFGISGLNVDTAKEAAKSITRIDKAIENVSAQRAAVGASINGMQSRINYLTEQSLRLTEAKSRITDADMAKEMIAFTKNNLLAQTNNMVLAQANLMQNNILNLFKMNLS